MDYNKEDEVKGDSRQRCNTDDHDDDVFSMSSYDGDQSDSLVIKPPQAKSHHHHRDKKEKKDRHRHKSDKHKDRHRNRDRSSGGGGGHEERKREHRKHRTKDGERREMKRHKDRSSKYDRLSNEGRKHEKERRREKGSRVVTGGEDFLMDYEHQHGRDRGSNQHTMRGHFGPPPLLHRDRKYEERSYGSQISAGHYHTSPREKTDREKRMERFMFAERQKEITQKEADARRQKWEEEKMVELRQRAEASMLKHTGRTGFSHVDYLGGRRKKQFEPETVEIISDEDNILGLEMEVDDEGGGGDSRSSNKRLKKEEDIREEQVVDVVTEVEKLEVVSTPKSSSSSDSSDSDSSSSSSSEEDEEVHGDDNEKDSKKKKEKESGSHSSGHSSSGDTTDEDKRSSDGERRTKGDEYLEQSPVPSPTELKERLPVYYPAIMGCRSVDEFTCLNRIEEGTYGVVYRAREKSTDQIVALKRLKMEKEREGFPITSLREVNTLLKGQHENIVTVREIVVGSNMDKIYIVMDYVEHDLKSLMEMMKTKKQSFTIGEVKTLMIQLLRAIQHLHNNWILHRDIKTSNLLLSHRGILKVGDFGLAREYGSPLKQYTSIVVTLWYRAPEILLGTKLYSCPIDIWSCGCVFGELLGMEPMFPGKSEIDQLNKIFKDLGTPSDKIWPGYNDLPVVKKTQFACFPYNQLKERFKTRLSQEGFNLMNSFLTYNPSKRITAAESLEHDYFHIEDPAPIATSMFPTWPAKSENPQGSRNKKADSPKPPSGGKNFKELGDGEDENIAGFFLGGAPNSGPGFTLKF